MTTVTVSPPVVNVCDILEYAKALLEEHPWRKGQRVPENENWDEVAKNGLSLHDAIGMACYRLSGEAGATTRGAKALSDKEFSYYSNGRQDSLRQETNRVIAEHLPRGQNDIAFNDAARDVNDVLAVLDTAIGEECK